VDKTTTTSDNTTQLLVVSSGRAASLFVGTEVPYLDYLTDYLLSQRVLTERIAWERVGAQLVVQPTIIGEGPNINIKLYPQLSGTVGGKPYTRQLIELATELEVADGRTLQIGGLGRHADFYNRFLIGVQRDGSTQSLNISLTPHILPAVGPR
jgi:type II secretory pathway component GspD/PulD (secretin)